MGPPLAVPVISSPSITTSNTRFIRIGLVIDWYHDRRSPCSWRSCMTSSSFSPREMPCSTPSLVNSSSTVWRWCPRGGTPPLPHAPPAPPHPPSPPPPPRAPL